jgi:hypothetical protein
MEKKPKPKNEQKVCIAVQASYHTYKQYLVAVNFCFFASASSFFTTSFFLILVFVFVSNLVGSKPTFCGEGVAFWEIARAKKLKPKISYPKNNFFFIVLHVKRVITYCSILRNWF